MNGPLPSGSEPAATLACLLLFGLSSTGVCADDADVLALRNRQSRAAIGAIWNDRHIPDSALAVHQLAAAMSAEERYEYLFERVIPSDDHATFRLALDFTTTSPAPVVVNENADSVRLNNQQAALLPAGGQLVSPALDLVQTATALGRLTELQAAAERTEVHDELQQRCRLAMLGLIDLAIGDEERAESRLTELFQRVEARTYDDFAGRWPETLAVHVGLTRPGTREAAAEMLYHMLQSQVRSETAHGPDAWDRWVTALGSRWTGQGSLQDAGTAEEQTAKPSTRNATWLSVSKTTAWSRGRGLSAAAWSYQPGRVTNMASHTEDYLYYRSPLRGNFEVECDVTGFNWRDSHLMVAGAYVAPIFDHVSYGLGSFRSPREAGKIEPRLTECGDWIRYRAVVRNGVCATYFNGRLIHNEQLPEDHDPWLGIRSIWYADGSVRDLRITGQPVIPERLRLSATHDLAGWYAYFDEPVGGVNDLWRQLGNVANGGEIVGNREPSLHDQACERLLLYHRPMFEDGAIEYEFYYVPGEYMVHPALDRRVWILDPRGVGVHWVTDGNFERNGLDPLNLTAEPANRRGPSSLPLRINAWNRLRLELTGDAVELSLNDALVYRDTLEPTNQRTFGLFHWSDQTEARVRNVVWRGDWPRRLPPVESQELAEEGPRWLDERLPQLSARFEHDFFRDGLLPQGFPAESKTRHTVQSTDKGARVIVQGNRGYTPGWIGPHLQLRGDFDVQAEFEQLELTGNADSSVGVFLMIVFSDPEVTHAGIYRGRLTKPHTADRVVVQTEFNRTKPSGIVMDWPGSTAEESTAGTFRLARRGDTIYCLFAEADSPHFRLIHKEVVPTAATRFDGLRLKSTTYSELDSTCQSAVTWKRLSIQAESITYAPKPAVAPPRKPAG